jgi:hypothetical protein
MKRVLFLAVSVFVFGSTNAVAEDARDWKLADKSIVTGSLDSIELVIRLPNGIPKNISITDLSPEDQRAVAKWVTNHAAQTAKVKPNAAVGRNANAGQRQPAAPAPNRIKDRNDLTRRFTAFGDVDASTKQISEFLDNCRKEKPKLLEDIRVRINSQSKSKPARDVTAMEQLFRFVSRPDVLIVPRNRFCGGYNGQIVKYEETESPLQPFGVVETLKVLDKRTVFVQLNCAKAILEGIDTSKLPIGKWNSEYLFREAGKRKIPATVGEEEITIYEAISNDGFPRDIILW